MSTLALFWSKNNPGEGRAPGARSQVDWPAPWGIPSALLASVWTSQGLWTHLGCGEARRSSLQLHPHLTSPKNSLSTPSSLIASFFYSHSKSSHAGHTQ